MVYRAGDITKNTHAGEFYDLYGSSGSAGGRVTTLLSLQEL